MNESVDRIFVEWLQEGPRAGVRPRAPTRARGDAPDPAATGLDHPRKVASDALAMRPALNARPFLLVVVVALLAVLAVGALVFVGSQPRPAPPVGPASNGSIVIGVGTEVWLANADGSDPHRLDIGLGQSISPVFSPDGTKLAFMTRVGAVTPYSLFVANADGTGARSVTGDMKVVTSELAGITWSPDGRTLVFASSDEGKSLVSGRRRRRRTRGPDRQAVESSVAGMVAGRRWLAYQGKPTSEEVVADDQPSGWQRRTDPGFGQGVQRRRSRVLSGRPIRSGSRTSDRYPVRTSSHSSISRARRRSSRCPMRTRSTRSGLRTVASSRTR